MIGLVEATPAQALTGIGNGSFETPVVTPGTFQTFAAGTSIGTWTVSQGTVDLIGSVFWQATDGGAVVANGGVIQSFTFDVTGKSFTNMGYVAKETHFIATGLTSTLEFRSTNAGAFGPVIDDVDVVSCLLVICIG